MNLQTVEFYLNNCETQVIEYNVNDNYNNMQIIIFEGQSGVEKVGGNTIKQILYQKIESTDNFQSLKIKL